MIDTDKYEGHTEGPWDWFPKTNDSHIGHLERHSNLTRVTAEIKSRSAENDANAQLIADAPLLLAEVIRLREENKMLRHGINDAIILGSSGAKTPVADGSIKHYFPLYLLEMVE